MSGAGSSAASAILRDWLVDRAPLTAHADDAFALRVAARRGLRPEFAESGRRPPGRHGTARCDRVSAAEEAAIGSRFSCPGRLLARPVGVAACWRAVPEPRRYYLSLHLRTTPRARPPRRRSRRMLGRMPCSPGRDEITAIVRPSNDPPARRCAGPHRRHCGGACLAHGAPRPRRRHSRLALDGDAQHRADLAPIYSRPRRAVSRGARPRPAAGRL